MGENEGCLNEKLLIFFSMAFWQAAGRRGVELTWKACVIADLSDFNDLRGQPTCKWNAEEWREKNTKGKLEAMEGIEKNKE